MITLITATPNCDKTCYHPLPPRPLPRPISLPQVCPLLLHFKVGIHAALCQPTPIAPPPSPSPAAPNFLATDSRPAASFQSGHSPALCQPTPIATPPSPSPATPNFFATGLRPAASFCLQSGRRSRAVPGGGAAGLSPPGRATNCSTHRAVGPV